LCILTSRQDNIVGYKTACELIDKFPRSTFSVLDCVGHLLEAEREPLFKKFVEDWLWRLDLNELPH